MTLLSAKPMMPALAAACCARALAAGGIPTFGKRRCLAGSELTYAVGPLGCGVAIHDWSGDGRLDLLFTTEYSGFDLGKEISIWYGQ